MNFLKIFILSLFFYINYVSNAQVGLVGRKKIFTIANEVSADRGEVIALYNPVFSYEIITSRVSSWVFQFRHSGFWERHPNYSMYDLAIYEKDEEPIKSNFQNFYIMRREYTKNSVLPAPIGNYCDYGINIYHANVKDTKYNSNLIKNIWGGGLRITFGKQRLISQRILFDYGLNLGFNFNFTKKSDDMSESQKTVFKSMINNNIISNIISVKFGFGFVH